MQYIKQLVADCHLALEAKPINEFVLNELSELDDIMTGIYVIEEIGGNPENTFLAFSNFKSTKTRKCARLNKPSQILYVGSSTTGMKKRIKQHYGYGYAGTYALHLKHWFENRNLKITIIEYDVKPKVLQIIEDAISFDKRPAFGKTGGNSR